MEKGSTIFVDTSYLIALFNPRDKFHGVANEQTKKIKKFRLNLLTTEVIVIEVADGLSTENFRQTATNILQKWLSDNFITVVPMNTELIQRASRLFIERPDKEWSLTDCISFIVMRELNINLALTSDHHFEQAGFRVLLK
jgi:predicted nucleic acid-binding protein